MSDYVFISYSSKDQKSAVKVCNLLEKKGIHCWIAPRDVRPGLPFAAQIVEAIENSRAVVLILSEHSNGSDHVMSEIDRAKDKRKNIFTFRIRDVKPSKELEYYISRSHWIDAWTSPLNAKVDDLAGAISGQIPQSPTPPPRKSIKTIVYCAMGVALLTAAVFFYIRIRNTHSETVDVAVSDAGQNAGQIPSGTASDSMVKRTTAVDAKQNRITQTSVLKPEYKDRAVTNVPLNETKISDPNAMHIVVLPFVNADRGGRDDETGWSISDAVRFKLAASSLVSIADRSIVEKIIRNKQAGDLSSNPEEGAVLGRQLDVKKVITGEYRFSSSKNFDVHICMVDAATGITDKIWSKDGISKDELDPVITQTVKDILNLVQYENAIAAIAGLQNPRKSFYVEVKCTRDTLKIGEFYNFAVKPNTDCYINILDFGTSGKISVLFPNKLQPENFVKANEVIWTPNLKVLPPAGLERVKIIATREEIPVVDVIRLVNQKNPFLDIAVGEASEFSRDLELTLSPLDKDNWSESTLEIKIIE